MLSTKSAATSGLTAKVLSEYTTFTSYVNTGAKGGWTLLSSQKLNANASQAYDLRLWITENAPVSIANKVFNSKIVVKARPTNQAS